MSGHEGPIVSLAFSPIISSTTLVTTSWDKTCRVWNAIENASDHENIQLFADGSYINILYITQLFFFIYKIINIMCIYI